MPRLTSTAIACRYASLAILAGVVIAPQVQAAGAELPPLSCIVLPEETVRISTQVAGIVSDVLVERGDVVEPGDVVARLEARIEEIALALAEARAASRARIAALDARVAFLEAQAARNERLMERNAIAETVVIESRLEAEIARHDLDDARLQLELAGIEAQQARALLEQKTLRAPIGGVVTERLMSPGEFRDPQSHVATIARLDTLIVEAFAPIGYFGSVAVGDVVTIVPEEPIGGEHAAVVSIVDRVFDAATATFGLRMDLPNPDFALPGGLRCEVRFGPPVDE